MEQPASDVSYSIRVNYVGAINEWKVGKFQGVYFRGKGAGRQPRLKTFICAGN